jgi:hypothetical protein
MTKVREAYSDTRPLGVKNSWASTYGTQLSGQAAIDGADHAAITMENKWGAGRLRLLVPVELRERFDRQRFLFNAAVWRGDLEELQREAKRMTAAWMALDRAAEAAGALKLDPLVWEVAMADGTVVALVRCPEDVSIATQGRQLVVYTLDEIATMLANYREVTKAKEIIPGAVVEAIRRTINDPLDGFRDGRRLEDTLNDDMPAFGN